MANLSFDITYSVEFYQKLLEDYEDFKSMPTSSRLALNCAMTSYHLFEWIFDEYKSNILSMYTKTTFRTHIKTICPSFAVMQKITNGTKHFISQISSHEEVQNTSLKTGAFSRVFSKAFEQAHLEIELNNGNKVWFDNQIETVVSFWKTYLETEIGITF